MQEERLRHHSHEEGNVLLLLQAQRIMEPPAHHRRGGPSTGRRLIVSEPAARRRQRVESEAIRRAGITEHLCLSSDRQQQISTRNTEVLPFFFQTALSPPESGRPGPISCRLSLGLDHQITNLPPANTGEEGPLKRIGDSAELSPQKPGEVHQEPRRRACANTNVSEVTSCL